MSTSEDKKSITVATINNQKIVILKQDGTEYVPVRPICDALGVDFSGQLQRIKRDPIFGSTVVTVTTVGADEKDREMVALPHELIFGWLFTIDTNLVRDEVREAVINYKRECNHALYVYFRSYADYTNYRNEKLEEVNAIEAEAMLQFNTAKERVKELRQMKDKVKNFTYDDWQAGVRQLELSFSE